MDRVASGIGRAGLLSRAPGLWALLADGMRWIAGGARYGESRAVISRDSRWALLIEGLRLIAGGEPGWAASRRGGRRPNHAFGLATWHGMRGDAGGSLSPSRTAFVPALCAPRLTTRVPGMSHCCIKARLHQLLVQMYHRARSAREEKFEL